MNHTHNYTAKITKNKEKCEATIEGELSTEEFSKFVATEIKLLIKEAELPGWRKGNAPEKLVIEKFGVDTVLFRAAEEALDHIYPHIIEDEKIESFGRPFVSITKLAKDNPLGFKIVVPLIPEIDFDYKKVATLENKKERVVEHVTDDEVRKVMLDVKRQEAKKLKKDGEPDEKEISAIEITDELVKRLGNFTDITDFKSKIKDGLLKEKEYKAKEKRHIELFNSLIKEANMTIPEAIIEAEKERLLMRFKHDVLRMGITWEDYMKHLGKNEVELKSEWQKDAKEKAALELILDHIAKKENISPDKNKLDEEVSHILSKEKEINKESVQAYVTNILTRQGVIEFLEKQ